MSVRFFIIPAISFLALAQLPVIQPVLDWQRNAIDHGEIWRLITGNLTHTNWPHMIMNSLALAIITFIFRRHLTPAILLKLILGLSCCVGLSLLWSDMNRYAGLSGVLHGLFAWGAIRDIEQEDKSGWLLLAGVTAKVLWEQWFGGSASSAALINARVAVEAHLAGAVAGTIWGACHVWTKRHWLRRS